MKKNVSINISGIVFHIEEDAYTLLKDYLNDIHHYFLSYQDHVEIVVDIENRIAEILLSKLSDNKQAIVVNDVETLKHAMGDISDFQADSDEETKQQGKQNHEGQDYASSRMHIDSTKIYRNEQGGILGGVCAGFAHYFGIDSVWPRIFFVLLAFGTLGLMVVIYVVLWIIIPVKVGMEERSDIRKMFRNPQHKILGGVASGIAAFLRIDITLVRVLFLFSLIFGGAGAVVYIVLWVILPEAKSITEQVQMQGDPVTLSNIETNIKKKS